MRISPILIIHIGIFTYFCGKHISMKKPILFIVFTCVAFQLAFSTRLLVPSQYATIQSAINAASQHDTVLVSPGTYFENINFRGRGIVLASTYILSHDTAMIDATIINGSQPADPDSASCVIIASKVPSTFSDTSAMIIGFRITGGTGTKWNDEHNPGSVYREGGGILVQYLSPRILHNHITYNQATDGSGGMASTGGGGIRCGDSNPLIANNVIDNNQGKYGAGIVFNYCGGIIRNNLIAHNTGGQDYGGSGLWILGESSPATPRLAINNTIIYNYSTGPGGGIRAWSTTMTIKNNILWGNTASLGSQIFAATSSVTAIYNDIQGGFAGSGNINLNPEFDVMNYYLSGISPCIDEGDSTAVYNDLSDPLNPSSALFPSKGTTRNDMGAYGGPGCSLFSSLSTIFTGVQSTIPVEEPQLTVNPNPVKDNSEVLFKYTGGEVFKTDVLDVNGLVVRRLKLNSPVPGEYRGMFSKDSLASGNYWLIISSDRKVLAKKSIAIY